MKLNTISLKIKSVFNIDLWQEGLLCVIYALLKDEIPFTMAFLIILILFIKHKKWWLALFFVLLLNLPINDTSPNTYIGKIIDIKNNYYIVQTETHKVLLYSDMNLNYDDSISFKGEYELIEGKYSNYGFDFKKFNNRQNIYYQIEAKDIALIKEGISIRNIIYSNTDSLFVKKFIFNINSDEDIISSFINSGYCFNSFLYLFLGLFSIFIKPKTLDKFELILLIFFGIFYHFNFISCRLLLNFIFKKLKLNNKQKSGWLALFSICFFPHNIFSLKFLLPYGINILYGLKYDKNYVTLYNLLLQSFLFSQVNLILLVGYKYFSKILGFCYLISIFHYFIDMTFIITIINNCLTIMDYFIIYQSPKSIILILLLIIYIIIPYKNPKVLTITIIILMYLGLFFPFASVSYINVGQGDSILIKDYFNKANYLIDTGKESAYKSLDTFLKAKGVKKIDILFITHYDSDHCANIEILKKDYDIEKVVDYHFNKIESNFTFYELNDNYLDKNANSLVLYTMINGKSLLFMGDATTENEKNIIEKYPLLKIDYLKLGHHGSKTSTSLEFIHSIQPKLAIISSGNFAYYQHPNPQVISTLNNLGIPYLVTNDDGDIEIYFTSLGEIIVSSNKKISFVFNPNIFNHDIIRAR